MTYKELIKSGMAFDASGITNPDAFQWQVLNGVYYPVDFNVIPVDVYRTKYDCTNGGVSSRHDTLYIPCKEGPFKASKVDQETILFPEQRAANHWALKPANRDKWWMAGGNLAYSSDSRVRTVYHIHDRTETMKQKYLAIKAFTNSEWDSVEFALIEMSNELKEQIIKTEAAIPKIDGVDFVGKISYDADFYTDKEELGISLDDEYEYVELSDEQVSKLSVPEQVVKYGTLQVTKKSFRFVSYGKHNEEFWTEWVHINFISDILSSKKKN